MNQASILPGFWFERQQVNAGRAIFHQWDMLEASGCLNNFRLAAGEAEVWREGSFFADSDAYKWLEAAARIWGAGILATDQAARLGEQMEALIALLGRAQSPDGYLFTYNQIHFPGVRWQNLQIEHELYCHGHLIEAGVSHFESTGQLSLLSLVRKAADRIVEDFRGKGALFTPGHEEIELALLRLFEVTQEPSYLELAQQFLEQRGRIPFFARQVTLQDQQVKQRKAQVRQARQAYLQAHPEFKPFQLPPGNRSEQPPHPRLRWYLSGLSGRYNQQHAPLRQQTTPEGHAVRFTYLETAAAMLARLSGDRTLLPPLQAAWEHMVTRRMYVTGGLGSQPATEGFGADYDLVPEYAYAETCAALGSLFWSWEMSRLTGEARYSDLFEWQLYNAAAVGMGMDGTTYLYNNPLRCRSGVTRQAWYAVPCCPSNLSRTWAGLGKCIYSAEPGGMRLHQYIDSAWQVEVRLANGGTAALQVELETGLPWEGWAKLKLVHVPEPLEAFVIHLRQPAWAGGMSVRWRGEPLLSVSPVAQPKWDQAAGGYDPRPAAFHALRQEWASGDELSITFEMPVQLRRAHPRVEGHRYKVAVTRGPLVYCLESVDNPGMDLFSERLDLRTVSPEWDEELLGGIIRLDAMTIQAERLTFIPYCLWGNRGPSSMTVWVRTW